jgi:1-acyl-sn-glycerol-3-phosphate acyltransferase
MEAIVTSARPAPIEQPAPGLRMSDADLLGVLRGIMGPALDPTDLSTRDVAFIRKLAPILYAIGMRYFRAEGEGLELVPTTGSFIAVGNHSGAPLLPDVVLLGGWWAMEMGVENPSYIMVHDFPFRIPLLRNLLAKAGAIPASRRNAERVLSAGARLLCFPGGDVDCMRSFRDRHRIDFQGHTGFVELAFKYGIPILPFVNVGGNEVYVTLFSGRGLARWTGLDRLTRVKAIPLTAGLPWGLWLTGFVPYLPLPAKFVYKVGAPIHLEHDPDRANDRDAVQAAYRRVTGVMQDMCDDLARRRRFPVIG